MAASQPEYSPEELHELLSGLMPEIPGYRVLRLLGRGGMSYVYLGVQQSLDRQVAIKVIQPGALRDEISKLRFEREAQIIAKLQHPCIVGIYEIGRTEHGLLYYVLPYLARGHLRQRDLRGDHRAIIEVLRALLWALDYAHGRGVVHRDVKAENVLFDNADRPLLTDFGIALSRRDRSRVTGHGLAVGSGAHMAPEQARGESVDGRADLYSLGVLTYEMLTGYLPYKNSDPLGLALMHAVDPVPPLPDGLAHWQPFIDRSMGKLPRDRFADAREMMVALDEVEAAIHRLGLPQPTSPQPRQSWHALGEWARAARERTPVVAPATGIEPPAASAVADTLSVDPAIAQSSARQAGWPSVSARARAAAQGARDVWNHLDRRVRIALPAAALAALLSALLWMVWPAGAPDRSASVASADAPPAPAAAAPPAMPAAMPAAAPAPATPPLDVTETGVDAALVLDSGEFDVDPMVEADPFADLPPDQRLLAFAAEQIQRRRLTQPPGNNAYESLLAAEALSADAAQFAELGTAWLAAATPYISTALAEGRDDAAIALLTRGRELASRLALQDSAALAGLRSAIADPLNLSLARAVEAGDVSALRALKARIRALGLPTAWFEPHWSKRLLLARPGDALPGAPGWRLLRLPSATQSGLAMQATPVSRADYAAFASATGRPAAQCRVRTAVMTLKKRSWQDPGFAQGGDHPAVCVSRPDALAYAAWAAQREGRSIALPDSADWQRHAAHDGARCSGGSAGCALDGTRSAAAAPASALGIRSGHGNVREWLAEGGAAQGSSWRDLADPRNSRGDAALDTARGYDDIGFRLVREVALAELEVSVD